jgi:hypothetical protein
MLLRESEQPWPADAEAAHCRHGRRMLSRESEQPWPADAQAAPPEGGAPHQRQSDADERSGNTILRVKRDKIIA